MTAEKDSKTPSSDVRILPAGSRALLIQPADRTRVAPLAAALRESGLPGVSDVLPAARTVLVTTEPAVSLRELDHAIRELATSAISAKTAAATDEDVVSIPVSYDGSDLDDVAGILGISAADVVAEHTRRIWTCAFVGFAPGFGYLTTDEPGLTVPRRDRSRTSVPPGAVALADGYSAVYPRRSPGGWQIIGSTDVAMWDLDRPEPALLAPGRRVRFVDGSRR